MDNYKISINQAGLSDEYESEAEFIPIVSDDDESDITEIDIPELLPILPLRNTVLFPGVIVPISLGRDKSLKLVREVQKNNGLFGALAQKEADVEDPKVEDLYQVGTIAKVIKLLEMPDGSTSAIIQGKTRFEVEEVV